MTAEQEKADLEVRTSICMHSRENGSLQSQVFEVEEDNVDLFEENELLKTGSSQSSCVLYSV